MADVLTTILQAIKEIDLAEPVFSSLYKALCLDKKNQFLLFTKPELVRGLSQTNITDTFSLVFDKIRDFGMCVEAVVILNGKYLDRYHIVSDHYGVIDKVTREPRKFLGGNAEKSFFSFFGKDVLALDVLGGFEFMERFGIDTEDLGRLWLTRETRKLASGMYCAYLEDVDVYLVNGFYPRMLRHFTREDSIVCGLVLQSDRPWKEIRGSFLGATDPLKAAPGSIRRELLEKKASLGLPVVSSNFNGVHASAGPLEALAELIRFTTDLRGHPGPRNPAEWSFGRRLVSEFPDDVVSSMLGNATVSFEGKSISAFDLTEEIDSDKAIGLLAKEKWRN